MKGNWIDNEAYFFVPFLAIVSFQTNFQETSNAESLAVIYCHAFISVWLFNDLNTKYIYHVVPKGVKERTSTEMVEVLTKG